MSTPATAIADENIIHIPTNVGLKPALTNPIVSRRPLSPQDLSLDPENLGRTVVWWLTLDRLIYCRLRSRPSHSFIKPTPTTSQKPPTKQSFISRSVEFVSSIPTA